MSGSSTPGQSGPGSNVNEGLLHIPLISKAGALPSDGFNVISRTLGGGSYPSAEMQLVYSTAPVDWTIYDLKTHVVDNIFKWAWAHFFFFIHTQLNGFKHF